MKRGFSLLEVMVAVGLLAVSLVAMINFQGQSTLRLAQAEKMTQSTFLARQKMAEILLQFDKEWEQQKVFPEDKSESGTFQDPYEKFSWEWHVRKVTLPMPAGEEGSPIASVFKLVNEQIKDSIREVKLTVKWKDRKKERSFDVVTHITKL